PPRKRGHRHRLFDGQPDSRRTGQRLPFSHLPPAAGGRGAALPLLSSRGGGHRRGDLQFPVRGGNDLGKKRATGGGPAGGAGGGAVEGKHGPLSAVNQACRLTRGNSTLFSR